MMRQMATLECDHRMLREVGDKDSHEFCRVCSMTFPVVKTEPYLDEEAS